MAKLTKAINPIKSAYKDFIDNGVKAAWKAGKDSKAAGGTFRKGLIERAKGFWNATDIADDIKSRLPQYEKVIRDKWDDLLVKTGGDVTQLADHGVKATNYEGFKDQMLQQFTNEKMGQAKLRRRITTGVAAVGAVGVGTSGARLVSGRAPWRDQHDNFDLPGIPII
jgi:hypothetical protein